MNAQRSDSIDTMPEFGSRQGRFIRKSESEGGRCMIRGETYFVPRFLTGKIASIWITCLSLCVFRKQSLISCMYNPISPSLIMW